MGGLGLPITVIDLASRKAVGWALADHMRTELVSNALTMASANTPAITRGDFHSDRGRQGSTPARAFRRLATDTASSCRWDEKGRVGTTRWSTVSCIG